MELLKNVWQTVLQDTMYNSTMGSLLNDFCVEIIRRIVVVDDIPSPIADGLVEILTDIINRAPSLFQVKIFERFYENIRKHIMACFNYRISLKFLFMLSLGKN